ncbi:MAG: substrate-binding domain-containing protein [Pirellulales bacterium]|nr:substrate-binding domain-containing protein [Pirellulales bacterium]
MKNVRFDSPHPPLLSRANLSEQFKEVLRADIAIGRWKTELPSERHLSREFQLSRPTLRIALHALQSEGIVQLQKGRPARVLATAGTDRRKLRTKQVIILVNTRIQPDLTSLATIFGPLQAHLHRHGYGIQVADPAPQGLRHLNTSMTRIDAEHRPAHYLLFSVPAEVQRWVADNGVPSLVVGSRAADVDLPAIEVDQEAIMRHAVEHLVRRGHRRICLITLPPFAVGVAAGIQAFQQACAKLEGKGVKGRAMASAARPAVLESALRRFLTSTHKPTAIIVTDLEVAIGLYSTLAEMRLRIPGDVSVVSTGYWPLLDFLCPMPTCYYYPWESIANRIVRILNRHWRLNQWSHEFLKLLPDLRSGGSVRSVS